MNEVSLIFTPSGVGKCLYTDAIPLQNLGRLTMIRLTTVEFNEATQEWEVKNRQNAVLFTSPSRQRCLDWEREHFSLEQNHEH